MEKQRDKAEKRKQRKLAKDSPPAEDSGDELEIEPENDDSHIPVEPSGDVLDG